MTPKNIQNPKPGRPFGSQKNNDPTSGITLVEVLITMFVLSIGILSSLLYFTTALNSGEVARDLTLATTHGEYILEEMRTLPTLTNITSHGDWATWADSAGLNTLPNETITVTYGGQPLANPLYIETTVNWVREGRTQNVVLRTEMTK